MCGIKGSAIMEGGWNRKSVSYCFCAALKYAHAHCPCERCNGKAVSRYTEYKHWKDSIALASASHRINNTLELTVTATTDVATDTSTTFSVAATSAYQDVTMSSCSTDDNISNKYSYISPALIVMHA